MPVPPLITPLLQWSDADGNPYAGGSIETYIVGTSTPKATWIDPTQTALNTNPVILDAAGRSLMFGDGDYRLILRDAVGNLIADFPATTLVSAAMYPVVSAPTIADAVHMLGIDDLIEAEAEARAAADAAEQAARIAADNALGVRIDDETAARIAADDALGHRIDTLPPPESPLPPGYSMRFGITTSDGRGNFNGTFSPPFPSECASIVTTAAGISDWAGITYISAAGFAGVTSSPLIGGDWHGGPLAVHWIAIGH